MTREACEKFVGPMPVDKFLLDFIPEAPEARPANEIAFSYPTVSEHEDAFVSLSTFKGISVLNRVYRSVRSKRRSSVPNSSL